MERKELLDLLVSRNMSLSSMESLTGGLFAACFTSIPGASKVFRGAAVTYTDKVKIAYGVNRSTILNHGAISAECSKEMAVRASAFYQSDCAVSFTGNAGPGESEGKPVGLVYISVKVGDMLYCYELNLKGTREEIRKQCVDFAFLTLKEKIEEISFKEE